jgi:NADH dehydrogenase FAD-containing subunit
MLETLTLEDDPVSGSESETEDQIIPPTAQSARQEQNVFFKNLLAMASLSSVLNLNNIFDFFEQTHKSRKRLDQAGTK